MITKNCSKCGHAKGGFSYGKCYLSGSYQDIERKHRDVCDVNFSGWKPKNPTLLQRIFKCLKDKE